MDAPSFIYEDKIVTVTHDMALHITSLRGVDFQTIFYCSCDNDYFLELVHILFTKLISNVPNDLTFKLYAYQIQSCMIPYKFVRDAFEILKPLISSNQKTRVIYERYFLDREEQRWTEMKPPVSLSSSEEEKRKRKLTWLLNLNLNQMRRRMERRKSRTNTRIK